VKDPRQVPDDATLLANAAGGSEPAFAVIYRRYASAVFGLALRVTGSREAAEEVAQDAFTRLWRSAGTFDRSRSSAAAWILRITRNRAIDELRRRGTRPERALGTWEDGLVAVSGDPVDASEHAEAGERVRRAVATLPPAQRDALALAFFDGLTHAEIAALRGEALGTVKTRIRLAMRRVKAALADEEGRR
jgi:RNA polymerase sigma-70 factor (ECF subfamily)